MAPVARPAAPQVVQVALLVVHLLQARQVPRPESSHRWDHQPVPSWEHATLRQDTQLAKTGSLSHAGAREAARDWSLTGFIRILKTDDAIDTPKKALLTE